MSQYIIRSVWFGIKPFLRLLATLLVIAPSLSALADTGQVYPEIRSSTLPSPQMLAEVLNVTTTNPEQSVQNDPLSSPYPIPWNWIMTTQAEIAANDGSGIRYYRSPSLVSPDGKYAAYSRIQLQVQPELHLSRVISVMFLENLQTGDLKTITASSPLADNPFISNEEADQPGTISVIIPVSWSDKGDRLLARQFEGIFSSSDASDYAVIWDREHNSVTTIAPQNFEYSSAVLLGWSQTHPSDVLFRAGNLGDENWPLLAVNPDGRTIATVGDQPKIFGQVVNHFWAGPQAHW